MLWQVRACPTQQELHLSSSPCLCSCCHGHAFLRTSVIWAGPQRAALTSCLDLRCALSLWIYLMIWSLGWPCYSHHFHPTFLPWDCAIPVSMRLLPCLPHHSSCLPAHPPVQSSCGTRTLILHPRKQKSAHTVKTPITSQQFCAAHCVWSWWWSSRKDFSKCGAH